MTARAAGGRARLLQGLAAGLLVFAAASALALAVLPEWSAERWPPERVFRHQYRILAGRAGFRLTQGEPRVSLVTRGKAPASLRTEVSHTVRYPWTGTTQSLSITFSRDGKAVEAEWGNFSVPLLSAPDLALYDHLRNDLPGLLLEPGEAAGATRRGDGPGTAGWQTIDLPGSSPREHLFLSISPPWTASAERRPGPPAGPASRPEDKLGRGLLLLLLYAAIAVAMALVFLSLLLRGRIDLTNGAILALVTLLSANLLRFFDVQASAWVSVMILILSTPWRAVVVFLAWSAGESLLRSVRPDFTTSLDSLRLGRLSRRGGRAILLGFAFGAALAGLRLGGYALAALLPRTEPAGSSIELPIFTFSQSPIGDGILAAALVTLALGLALRYLPERWVLPAAALAAGYVLSPLKAVPFPAELAANAALAGLLVWVGRRHGLTALLGAAMVSALLPAALLSALHLARIPGSFALTAGLSAVLLTLGLIGAARPEEAETENLPPPAFMHRLAEERRLRHEVDLLARMQVGLLPQEMPRVEGYEIAARSVLASEAGGDLYDFLHDDAGRLWIAAGDVAGHGYSCAIAQAMVKAGLLSLIEPEETPGEVLRQLDRVLREVSSDHSFTSLALVRLDPASGEALVGNAGHPYPLVFAAGRVSEIDLPGLPLGRGPAHEFIDRPFQLPSGGALLLCSDGLFEALDAGGNAYGFDRVREVLQLMGHRPAPEIVDALLNDCRRHLGAEQAPDDVTVVAVKRA
jgi:hypothetical protein